jgi:hypothetical protein
VVSCRRAANNPFTPTFGSPPPLLAGREELIELFGEALDDGPGRQDGRLSIPERVARSLLPWRTRASPPRAGDSASWRTL